MQNENLRNELNNIVVSDDLLARTRHAVAKTRMEASEMKDKTSKSKSRIIVPTLSLAVCAVVILAGVFVIWPMLQNRLTINQMSSPMATTAMKDEALTSAMTTVADTSQTGAAAIGEDTTTTTSIIKTEEQAATTSVSQSEVTNSEPAATTFATQSLETDSEPAPTTLATQTEDTGDEFLAEATQEQEGVLVFPDYEDIMTVLKACWDNAGYQYNYGVPGDVDVGEEEAVPESTTAAATTPDKAAAEAPASGSSDHSQTNVQVEGVDEADIIKTDGDFVYYVVNACLYVVDIQDPEDMKLVAKKDNFLENGSRSYYELYFDEETKTLSLIGNAYVYYYDTYYEDGTGAETSVTDMYMPYSYTFVESYDATDPEDLELIRSFAQEGYYMSSRRVDDTLYLITNTYIYSYYNQVSQDMIPHVSENGEDWELIPAKNIFITNPEYADSFTVVSSVNTVDADEDPVSKAVLGEGNIIYSTPDTLYIAGTIWDNRIYMTMNDFTDDLEDEETEASADDDVYKTRILSFSITDGKLKPRASGLVNGTILNQYCMDEYEGALRIATTSGRWTGETSNNIIALEEDDLSVISSLTHLAPGESIYSARFNGDRIYLVTFVQVDPFFVIDASDPKDMKVLGELKIPGYSNYMHMITDDLVLAIGNETYTQGGGVRTAGLKIAVFDVSDPEKPKQVSKLIYGTSFGYSEVQYNPKALLLDLSRGFIGLQLSFDKPAGEFGSEYVDGYVLIGIDENGNLSHMNLFNNYDANINYGITRGIYVGDTLFLVGYSEIASFDLKNFTHIDTFNFAEAALEKPVKDDGGKVNETGGNIDDGGFA